MGPAEKPLRLTFRCAAELQGLIPPPVPAAANLPDWFKAMPPQALNEMSLRDDDTVKRCPPFIDAMTHGFLMPLICDLRIENGEVHWDNDALPPGGSLAYVRSPISFHGPHQVSGTPLFAPDRFLLKFHNLWTIEAPDGYAVLFTHPFNRFDLPFTTLTGLVDCDRYHDNWIHFPARWNDPNFSGVLRKGTPVAQCVPVRRESWAFDTLPFTADDARRVHDLTNAIGRESGLYRKQFRA